MSQSQTRQKYDMNSIRLTVSMDSQIFTEVEKTLCMFVHSTFANMQVGQQTGFRICIESKSEWTSRMKK